MKCHKQCNMCGDVGFAVELFLCSKCRARWQHKYCSRLYPNLGHGNIVWECDWCSKASAAAAAKAGAAAAADELGHSKVMGIKKPQLKKKGLLASSSGLQKHLSQQQTKEPQQQQQQQQQQTKEQQRQQLQKKHYALELLLLAVQSMSELEAPDQKNMNSSKSNSSSSSQRVMLRDEEGYGIVERQACSSKRTLASKRSLKGEPNSSSSRIDKGIDSTSSSGGTKLVPGQRYKLLSEVLC